MRLGTKTTLLTLTLMGGMVLLLVTVSLVAFRQFSLSTAEDQVRAAAEVVRVSLTESMINGVIDRRQSFLDRLAEVPGLTAAQVRRAPAVVTQFGDGLAEAESVDEIDRQVMDTGEAVFRMDGSEISPVFRGTIPFIATSTGSPNCLQCHQVARGTVLGVITIKISLTVLQRKALLTVLTMTGIVALFAVAFTLLFRRQLSPVVATAQGVQEVVARAKEGDFMGRIEYQGADEVGQIAEDLNRLMEHLHHSLGNITSDVARLMEYELSGKRNLITTTTEMVEALVDVAQFKQAVEEDQSTQEVYARIGRVVKNHFSVVHFTIYEVSTTKNHMRAVVVDGESNAPCRWCHPDILSQADACRAQRTGHEIGSLSHTHICGQFLGEEGRSREHICIPVLHSGAVGSIVQLVMDRSDGPKVRLLVPFIKVYLRESAPVIEAKRLMDTLRESALRDALTGLHNRRFLEEFVETLIATAKRKENHISVLMMDLDHFKSVNDTYGHDVGDIVLKALARVLESQVRTSDLVVRFGGEEFMVILQENAGYNGPRMGEKIRAAVERMVIPIPGGTLQKTISIGVANFPVDSPDFKEVIKFADAALYKAKADGRNRVTTFSRGLDALVPVQERKLNS
ncbi:MAG: diguanylate cyclase [Magnetococcales bacterium]|nr:diguanylate cyclase [Magnetococcales bacterium]MBF0156536.1 diguanylate cyclase [Magnetococcales bacterium]